MESFGAESKNGWPCLDAEIADVLECFRRVVCRQNESWLFRIDLPGIAFPLSGLGRTDKVELREKLLPGCVENAEGPSHLIDCRHFKQFIGWNFGVAKTRFEEMSICLPSLV